MLSHSQATDILIARLPCPDRGDIIRSKSGGDSCYCHRFGALTPIAQADVETRTCLVCQGFEWPAERGRHDQETTSGGLTVELSRRARTQPNRTVDASGVTLCCVDCVNPDLAAFALDMSRRGADFSRVLLLSDERPSVLPAGIEWIELPEKLDKDGYNLFILRRLHSYIDTRHVVTIQTDGWLIRPELFRREWLEFDYVGAPWAKERWHADKSLVGNSGCCLRSKLLMETTARLADEDLIRRECRGDIYDDVVTCYVLYDELVRRGMRFADPDTAADFAIELSTRHGQFIGQTCGYHGRRHAPTHWLERELEAWKARTTWRANGGKIRLCINPYFQDNPYRQAELDDCFLANVDDGYFDESVEITCQGVPQFDAFTQSLESFLIDDDTINVFCNSDIYFDEFIIDLCQMEQNDFACITRHEKDGGGWRLWEECGHRSQDAWAYRGRCKIPITELAKLKPGTPGVDNRIAWLAKQAGYRVINPSRDVRAYHLHADASRRPGIERERVGPPYLHVWPHSFADAREGGRGVRTEAVEAGEYIGPGASAVYHPIRRDPWGPSSDTGGNGVIYLSVDAEQSNGEIWQELQENCGAVLMYPYSLNRGDICIVEATLGSEFIPKNAGRGLVVCAFLHDYHIRREATGERRWNIIIHRIETAVVGCHRVAVPTSDDGSELASVAQEIIDRNRKSIPVDCVGDWTEYVATLRRGEID